MDAGWADGDARRRAEDEEQPRLLRDFGRPGEGGSPPEHLLRRFGTLRVTTWNAAELLGGWFASPASLAAKRRRLRMLLDNCDVLLLQETRGVSADLEGLPPSHLYLGTFDIHRADAAGTARGGTFVAVRRDWAQAAVDVRVEVIARARALGVVLRWGQASLAVASVHLDPALQPSGRAALLESIRRWVDRSSTSFVLLGGDWNFVPSDEKRMTGDGADAHSADRTGERFERLFEDFAEVFQPDFTWSRRLASGIEGTRSRIDRVYAKVGHMQVARIVWSAAVAGSLTEHMRPSDHVPVVVVARVRTLRSRSAAPIPPYIFSLPAFWERFDRYTVAHDTIVDPGERLDEYVAEMRRAASWVRSLPESVLQGGPRGRVDAILRAVAADRAGDAGRARRFLEAVPEASHCMLSTGIDRARALSLHRSLVEIALASSGPRSPTCKRRAGARRSAATLRLYGCGAAGSGPRHCAPRTASCSRPLLR